MKYVTAPGRYRAYVERPTTGGWLSQTENGSEFVRIPLVIDPEDPGQGGAKITWNGFLNTDKVIDRTTRMLMDALHVPVNWFELLAQGDSFLEGRAVLITVEQATKSNDNGTRSPRYTKGGDPIYEVSWLNDPEKQREVAILDNNKVSSLARKMRAISQAIHSESPAPGQQQRTAAPRTQPVEAPRRTVKASDPIDDLADDDIPF
jgi:hypothetical protein